MCSCQSLRVVHFNIHKFIIHLVSACNGDGVGKA